MAAIPVNIQGTLTYADTGIGGGPMPGGPGGPPLGIWGGTPPAYVDIGFPGPQPPGTPPLEIWGPIGDYIDAGFPGPQPPAGKPPRPTHPIYYPPVIWPPPGPLVGIEHPIAPGGEPPTTPKVEWKTAWSPSTGWVVVGVPTGEHVTPSAQPPTPTTAKK